MTVDKNSSNKLVLSVPADRLHEYEYGAAVLFGACLNWPVRVIAGTAGSVELSIDQSVVLRSPAIELGQPATDELTGVDPGVAHFESVASQNGSWPKILPGLVSESMQSSSGTRIAELDGDTVKLAFDMVWTVYFIASGAWEIRYGKLDQHQRVQGVGSWLETNGFANHPVINYYAKTLAALVGSTHNLTEPNRQYERFVSCDVDRPFDPACYETKRFLKRLTRNLIVERSVSAAKQTVTLRSAVKKRGWAADPNNAFDYMLDLNEKAGNQIQFFFLAENQNPYDAEYDLSEPRIQGLLSQLVDAGHRVGIHGSFDSQFEDDRLELEHERLNSAIGNARSSADTNQIPLINRQHWLRWRSQESPALTYNAGIREDWSLGFNDCSGFRRSICTPFPMYDFDAQRTLDLLERPLLVMECSEIGVNHTIDADWETIESRYTECANQCRSVSGEFHMLWHNHHLITPYHRAMYERLILA